MGNAVADGSPSHVDRMRPMRRVVFPGDHKGRPYGGVSRQLMVAGQGYEPNREQRRGDARSLRVDDEFLESVVVAKGHHEESVVR